MDQSAPDPGNTLSIEEYLRLVPTDEESARRAVEPYLHLTPQQRWMAFEAVLRQADALLGGRAPWRGEVEAPFWRHWMDPSLGRPR